MKRIFLYASCLMFALSSCRKDEEQEMYREPENIETQNVYDDQAIQNFLETNYLDNLGNIVEFDPYDTSDDNETKLADLNPQKTASGVVYIIRNNAQPNTGNTIGDNDIIRFLSKTQSYIATEINGKGTFFSSSPFMSSLDTTGTPEVDPKYYYVTNEVANKAGQSKSYYEIEGFREALQKFKAFDKQDSENYNLQGVIIVPSRAAFARDPHYNYTGYSMRNRSIVFNFQVYKSTPRP